ncbi:hypothetical protein [Streptomyces hygroscopicus]|uniref:hypothetical protein n=1 Tax=Streptomyces hygroscopicus TaxID=1912 RepID=UPI0020640B59|nr:hypothetical protein HOK021_45980 [Streptomyces hygroscopicus]
MTTDARGLCGTQRGAGGATSPNPEPGRLRLFVTSSKTSPRKREESCASYLPWLPDHHHEFESLVKERLGTEAAEAVEWSNP